MKEIYSAYGIAPQRPGQPPKPTLYAPGANITTNSSQPPLTGFGSGSVPPPPMSSGYPSQAPVLAPGFKPPGAYPSGPPQMVTLPHMSTTMNAGLLSLAVLLLRNNRYDCIYSIKWSHEHSTQSNPLGGSQVSVIRQHSKCF